MVTTRVIKIDIINAKKVIDTIDKINIIVEKYAKIRNIPWVYNTYFHVDDKNPRLVTLKRINFVREFYHKEMDKTYENSPFNKDKTMYEIVQLYIKDYYHYYVQIEDFIIKFLYGMPEALKAEDFVELNKLFRLVKKYEKSAENEIT